MSRAFRMLFMLLAGALWLAGGLACGPKAGVTHQSDFDRAVERFVAGDYPGTIERMQKVADAATDDAVRQDAYTYIGRAHMALGETDDAITAFTLGARYGDRGPCVAYLELLKQHVEGDPKALHVREGITRGQLAGAIVRMMDETATLPLTNPNGPTPLALLAERGWMPSTPDGLAHADDPVTGAALYVIVARILADRGRSDSMNKIIAGGYAEAARLQGPVSGADALAILERVRLVQEKHGR